MTETSTLIAQLRVLAHLTRAQSQVARLRLPQATDSTVRDVLRQAAADVDGRAGRIADVLRDLGALPDPVGPVLGRVAALIRGAVEQAQPLDEALLGDLALEHQVGDRARYVATLADAAALPAVRALADDLVAAYAAGVERLHGILDDLARGRTAALDPSPLQRVSAQVSRAANAPGRAALDEAGAAVRGTVDRAVDTAGDVAGSAGSAVSAGRDALTAGRDTALEAAGTVLAAGGDALATGRDTAENLVRHVTGTTDTPAEPTAWHDADDVLPVTTVPDTSTVMPEDEPTPDPSTPPIPGFAELPAHAAIAALRTLDDPRDVAALVAVEQAHGNRPAVLAAARVRTGALPAARRNVATV